MRIEIIATGEELLDGRVTNSNTRDIAEILQEYGQQLARSTTVGDDPDVLQEIFRECSNRADVVIVTGGLGPTDDDRTSAELASFAGVELERRPELIPRIRAVIEGRGRKMREGHLKQCELPVGSMDIINPVGSAPGFSLSVGQCTFFALPGVPKEMRPMMRSIIPRFAANKGEVFKPKLYRVCSFGWGESKIADELQSLYPLPEGVEISYRAHFPEVHITLKVFENAYKNNNFIFDELSGEIRHRLAPVIYTENDESYAQSLGYLLRERGLSLAMAESCTGGMVGQILTAEAGASDYFLASAVTYHDKAKQIFLGVSSDSLQKSGAVSEEVAKEMAEGVRRATKASLGGAITGIAGPDGGTPEKPVGTVHIALAYEGETRHALLLLSGNRERIRTIASYSILQMIRSYLEETQ